MTLLRQRSPSTMSFHPDPESGMDDLDITILKQVEMFPGISVKTLSNRMTFYNKDNPSEELHANYWLIYYRVTTLEKEGLLVTRRIATEKAMERRCFPKKGGDPP
jgi:hypothetical protein